MEETSLRMRFEARLCVCPERTRHRASPGGWLGGWVVGFDAGWINVCAAPHRNEAESSKQADE